jgi:carboxyl-terminal processing protease
MNRKISLGSAMSFMAIVAAVTFTITMLFSMNLFNNRVLNVNERQQFYKKIDEIDKIVRLNYNGEIDPQTLLDSVASGYAKGTGDKYARYYTPEQYDKQKRENEGKLIGIGVVAFLDESGYIKIQTVYKDTPAMVSGLKDGDLIVSVDGKDIKAVGAEAAYDLLTGDIGTAVTIGYRRAAEDKSVEIIRKKYEIPSVEYKKIGHLGYVRILAFSTATVKQFNDAVDSLMKQKVTGLIFDVRDNAGGTLDSVCQMLDKLVPVGDLGTTNKTNGEKRTIYRSNASEIKLPMITIGNSNSASASEFFIACLRDFNKAKMVGSKTFGKGVAQTTFQLLDGSAISITTSFFNAPKTPNFNNIGLLPDFDVNLTEEQEKQLKYGDQTKDLQLKKAIELLSAKK